MRFRLGAGWSSPVARQAHNLKVTGSNPVPATKPHTAQEAAARGGFWRSGFRTAAKSPNGRSSLAPTDLRRRWIRGARRGTLLPPKVSHHRRRSTAAGGARTCSRSGQRPSEGSGRAGEAGLEQVLGALQPLAGEHDRLRPVDGTSIRPFRWSLSDVAQANPFEARSPSWSVSHIRASTASSTRSSSISMHARYHTLWSRDRGGSPGASRWHASGLGLDLARTDAQSASRRTPRQIRIEYRPTPRQSGAPPGIFMSTTLQLVAVRLIT